MLDQTQVNRENALAVADHIESLPMDRFHMNTWLALTDNPQDKVPNTPCNTVGCIATWTVRLIRPWELARMTSLNELQSMAAFLLGLNPTAADSLFTAKNHPWEENYYQMTGRDAARTLRHLGNTGRLEWDLSEDHQCVQDCPDPRVVYMQVYQSDEPPL